MSANPHPATTQEPVPQLDLAAQYAGIGDEIRVAVERVLASQQFVLGREGAAFEQEIAQLCGVAHGIGTGSGTDALMLGPRIEGENGVALRPPVLDDYHRYSKWMLEPGATRFWAPRWTTDTTESVVERMHRQTESRTQVNWAIAYDDETVGFTGVFDIDWVRRDGVTGLLIGRIDLYGRGIASEAVRLRMAFIWYQLGLRRTHNWIAHANRGSRRANEKSGYRQMGLFSKEYFRSGDWYDTWLGEAFPETYPKERIPSPWREEMSRD